MWVLHLQWLACYRTSRLNLIMESGSLAIVSCVFPELSSSLAGETMLVDYLIAFPLRSVTLLDLHRGEEWGKQLVYFEKKQQYPKLEKLFQQGCLLLPPSSFPTKKKQALSTQGLNNLRLSVHNSFAAQLFLHLHWNVKRTDINLVTPPDLGQSCYPSFSPPWNFLNCPSLFNHLIICHYVLIFSSFPPCLRGLVISQKGGISIF